MYRLLASMRASLFFFSAMLPPHFYCSGAMYQRRACCYLCALSSERLGPVLTCCPRSEKQGLSKRLSKVLRGCAGISFYYPVPLRQPQRLRQADDPAKQRHSQHQKKHTSYSMPPSVIYGMLPSIYGMLPSADRLCKDLSADFLREFSMMRVSDRHPQFRRQGQ